MKELAQALVIQGAAEELADQRERRNLAKFCRVNAEINRNIPHIEDKDNPLTLAIGMVNAFSNGTENGGDSGGKDGGAPVASPSPSGAVGGQAQTVPSPASGGGSQAASGGNDRQGQNAASPRAVNPGTGVSHPQTSGGSNARSPWLQAIPWVIAATSTLGGVGAVGYGLGRNNSDSVTVIEESDAEYPLLDYIEEQGWHRK